MQKRLLPTIFLALIALRYVIYGESCTVDSGQTVAFNLDAGATAAWNQSFAVKQKSFISQKSISFWAQQSSGSNIVFGTAGFSNAANVNISLFTVNGRCVWTTALSGNSSNSFGVMLPPGMYLARCDANGTIVRTTLFIAERQP